MEEERDRKLREYLAGIRKTIAESESMLSQVELRMAETDRMLASQGMTREQVLSLQFSDEQLEAANRELERRGMPPVEDPWLEGRRSEGRRSEGQRSEGRRSEGREIDGRQDFGLSTLDQTAADGGADERRRKFGMMMKPFRL